MISFILHIFPLKTWFDNRAINEALLEMIQSLQMDNDQVTGIFSTLEKDTANLKNKTQSMTEDAETLREFILLNVLIILCQRVMIY